MRLRAAAIAILIITSAAASGQELGVRLYAAGSLRAVMTELGQAFTASGGSVVNATFGASGLLKRLPVQDLHDVRQMRAGGAAVAGSEQVRHYKGVLLRDVLAAAKPVEKEHRELRQSIVVATATDGYKAVFSWAELFLSPIGDGALVIFERDGGPLAPSEGPLALVSLRDTQPGPRHVKWLVKIDLLRVRE